MVQGEESLRAEGNQGVDKEGGGGVEEERVAICARPQKEESRGERRRGRAAFQ